MPLIAGSTSALPEAFTGQTDRNEWTRPRTHQNLIYNVKKITPPRLNPCGPKPDENNAMPAELPLGMSGYHAAFAYFSVTSRAALAAHSQSIRQSSTPLNKRSGGGERVRTDDPLLAKQVLSQLSYAP